MEDVNRRARSIRRLLSLAVVAIGGVLVRGATASPATNWMVIYNPADFPTVHALITFLGSLRVPIPPVISAAEILSFQLTGSTDPVTNYFYKISLVGAYVLALWFAYPARARMFASCISGVVFLWATSIIHPMNPQVYDACFPFFVLLAFVFLKMVERAPADKSGGRYGLCLGAGFFLSMTELCRPFVFILLPILLLGTYGLLHRAPRRMFATLLVPLCLLTGLWHVHLFAAYHQILSTNHSGFNLRRAWLAAPISMGALVREVHNQPVTTSRWPNLNTGEHYTNSQVLQRDVLRYIVTHPRETVPHALGRIFYFISGPTVMFVGTPFESTPPSQPVLSVYKLLTPAAFVFLFINVVRLAAYALKAGGRSYLLLASADNLLVVFTFLSLLVLSLGEANEEARLALSMLPLLAAYPVATPALYDPVEWPALQPHPVT